MRSPTPSHSLSPRLYPSLCLCLFLSLPSCDVDERALDSGDDASGGTNSAGTSNGGSGGTDAQGGAMNASGGTMNGGSGGTSSDAGTTPRDCGAFGETCCSDAPACDDGLACDTAANNRCVRCAAFESIGILQGFTASFVQGISADGRWVVGYMEGALGNMAFRRERGSGTEAEPLGVLAGGTSSEARAVSRDGFAIVGTANTAAGDRGFRWTAGNMADLGLWNVNDTESRAEDVSADGNVVALTGTDINGSRLAFLWSNGGGKSPIISMEQARGISADGNVVVGNRQGAGNEAAITTTEGVQSMGALNGDSVAFAFGISSDGSTGFGTSGSASIHGFRYRNNTIEAATGITRVLAASGDGSVLGGETTAATCSGGRAGVWTPAQGAQALACDILPDGIVPNGWALTFVTAISDDGRVLGGEGVNPMGVTESWVAVVGPDCR